MSSVAASPAPPNSLARAWPTALAVVAAVGLTAAMIVAWPFTVDDTYITLRYSRNVAEGLGPTFNATGPRAEGYTSLLWMVILALPHALHLDALLVAKALGAGCTLATLVVAGRWARAEAAARAPGEDPRIAAAVAVACAVAIPATTVHAVSGMETGLFRLLVTALLARAASEVRGDARSPYVLGLLALASGLTRPEGNLGAGVAFVVTGALVPKSRRLRLGLSAALVWLLPLFAYELWRWSYYGLPLPLPSYVKLSSPELLLGWPIVRGWLFSPVLFFAPLLAPLAVRTPRSLGPAIATIVAVAAFLTMPEHMMGFEHRYLAPLDPTLGVLAGVGIAGARAPGRRGSRSARGKAAGAAIAVSIGIEALGAPDVIRDEIRYGEGLAAAHERLGRELFALGIEDGRLAISDAGATPYLSRWWTLDLVGLNDAWIATTGRRDPDHVFGERPDVIVFASESAERFSPWSWNEWERPLYDACLARGFARVTLRRFAPDYWLWVMARPGSAVWAGLSDAERRAIH